MKIIHRRDRNTRGLAKVVSAKEYLLDTAGDLGAIKILNDSKFAIVQERRNLGVALLNELDQQKYGKGL